MKRRELLRNSALFLGVASIGGTSLLFQSCKPNMKDNWEPRFFTEEESNLLVDIAETIIPKTETPGATDAKVVRYLDEYSNNFLEPIEQERSRKALQVFDDFSVQLHGKKFTKLNERQRGSVLQAMFDDKKVAVDSPKKVFTRMRSAVSSAFFASEVGATQVLDYNPIPGNYDGDIALKDTKGLVYSG